MWTLGLVLETLERPRAEERSGTRTDLGNTSGNFPQGELSGDLRDIVGAAVGMSGTTYDRAKTVGPGGPEASTRRLLWRLASRIVWTMEEVVGLLEANEE